MNKILSILSIILLGFSSLQGQDEVQNHVPHLNNHYFVPNSTSPAAFTNTYFGMSLGLAQSNSYESIILEIDGEPLIGLKGELVFADLSFDYQQRIKEWIAFYVSLGVTARIGTELQSMLTQGVNTVSSFRAGWLVKLVKKEKYMLSGSVQINNYDATFINIQDFVEDLIKDSTVTSIARDVPILNGSAGLRFAYGLNEIVGLQIHAEAGYGESYERGASDFIYQLGALVDVNLATKTKVPLGFALFFNASALPDLVQVKDQSALNSGIKISYTGGEHFNMGLELATLHVPIPGVEEKVSSVAAFITTKYYFNGDR